MSKKMKEYGRRLSTTPRISFKVIGYSIPVILIFTFLLSYHFKTDLYFGIGGLLSILLALISTQGDQHYYEAYKNGLKIPIIGGFRFFRQFVPYRDIVYVCRYDFPYRRSKKYCEGLVVFFKRRHKEQVLRFKKPDNYPPGGRMKYAFWVIFDGARIPFNLVIPCMKKHLENWSDIYSPDVILKDFGELDRLYLELNTQGGTVCNGQ